MIPINNIVPSYSYYVHILMQKYHVISIYGSVGYSWLYPYIISINYSCFISIILSIQYPHEKIPRHPLDSWFTSQNEAPRPEVIDNLDMLLDEARPRYGSFFWVKHGKTNHFKGKILGMIYYIKWELTLQMFFCISPVSSP